MIQLPPVVRVGDWTRQYAWGLPAISKASGIPIRQLLKQCVEENADLTALEVYNLCEHSDAFSGSPTACILLTHIYGFSVDNPDQIITFLRSMDRRLPAISFVVHMKTFELLLGLPEQSLFSRFEEIQRQERLNPGA